ncbi:MAG: oligosaccharide repeat unit polymerase [Anaerolineae bacterium]|nr:oligosaccharide repeat unit polymerase [Anaerolineae bacterium]
MFWIYLVLAILSLVLSNALYKSPMSPIGFFGVLWNSLLALFEARLTQYYPLSFQAHLVFLGSYLLFVIGAFSATSPIIKITRTNFNLFHTPTPTNLLDLTRSQRALDFMNMMNLIGLMLGILRLAGSVGWGNILNLAHVRSFVSAMGATEKIWGGLIGYLSSLSPLNAILGGVYYSERTPHDWKRVTLVFAVPLGFALLSGNRTIFIWTAVLFFVAHTLTHTLCNHGTFLRLVRPVLLGVILLFVVFTSIGTRRFDSTSQTMHANVELPWELLHAYNYMTAGFGAFSARLTHLDPLSIPGLMTLSPVIRMLARIDPDLIGGYSYDALLVYTIRNPSIATPVRTNVFTYLWGVFNDFGWIGILIVPWGMGITSGLVFKHLLQHPTFVNIALYSFFCLQFVYSSIATITHANSIIVSLMVLLLIHKLISAQGVERNVSSYLPVVSSATLSK